MVYYHASIKNEVNYYCLKKTFILATTHVLRTFQEIVKDLPELYTHNYIPDTKLAPYGSSWSSFTEEQEEEREDEEEESGRKRQRQSKKF